MKYKLDHDIRVYLTRRVGGEGELNEDLLRFVLDRNEISEFFIERMITDLSSAEFGFPLDSGCFIKVDDDYDNL